MEGVLTHSRLANRGHGLLLRACLDVEGLGYVPGPLFMIDVLT